MEAIVSQKGWIVIPKALRQKFNIKPGTKVRLVDYGNGISIVPIPADPVQALRGLFAEEASLTEDLLAERKKEREKEDKNGG